MRRFSILTLLAVVFSIPAGGAVIYVDADATAGADTGTSWTNAHVSLQTALGRCAGGDVIRVAEGVYTPTTGTDRDVAFELVAGVDLYGGYAGVGSSDPNDRDVTLHETVLSGDIGAAYNTSDNSYNVLLGASDVRLDGFTISSGNASFDSTDGGGLYLDFVTDMRIVDCTFSDNTASDEGGAIGGLGSSFSIEGCTFLNNSAQSEGGAVVCGGSVCDARDCTFEGNSSSYYGGALSAWYSSLTLTGCAFTFNGSNEDGGGVHMYNVTVSVTGCLFSYNEATSMGGGLFLDGSPCTVVDSVFFQNHAYGGGGASVAYASPEFTNCVFYDNWIGSLGGGGVHNEYASPAFTNCTFVLNSATAGGAGAHNDHSSSTFVNCVLWDAHTASTPEICDHGGSSAVTYSVIAGGRPGVGNVSVDPLVGHQEGDDGVPGTSDDVYVLQPFSPCIDAADGDAAPATDMYGNARYDDTGLVDAGTGTPTYADTGALEYQATTATTSVSVCSPHSAGPGEELSITWLASGDIASVRVELSRDGGATWEDLAASTPNDRHLAWTVTDGGAALPQVDCIVRVSDAADGEPSGTSTSFGILDGAWRVDADAPGPAHDGFTWATAFTHPQDAVDAARAGQQVHVAQGTYARRGGTGYVVLTMNEGVDLFGGYAGYGEADPDARDAAAQVTTLDGEDIVYHVVVTASDGTLDGFTLTRGNARLSPPSSYGGAIYDNETTGTSIASCVLAANNAQRGGAIYTTLSEVSVSECTFIDNAATQHGGGIRIHDTASVSVTACTFSNNTASNGGAVYIDGDSYPTIADCVFVGNSATSAGGGIRATAPLGLSVASCVFSGNGAGTAGGAMYCHLLDPATIANCTVANNTAVDEGGGMYAYTDGDLVIVNCILWGNTAAASPQIQHGITAPTVARSIVQGGWAGVAVYDHDPLLADADGADDVVGTLDDDLRLLAGSPAIDAADGDAAPAADIEFNPRHDDTGTGDAGTGTPTYADIGAHEFTGTTVVESVAVETPVAVTCDGEYAIRWLASGDVPDVKIELSRNGGTDWETIVASTPNDREYTWTVTDGVQSLPQADCMLRVSDPVDDTPTATSGTFAIIDGWRVDADAPGPSHDGLTWATAFLHPQDALDVAPEGTDVFVAEGTYTRRDGSDTFVVTMRDGVALEGGYAGYGQPDPDEHDVAAHATTLDGSDVVWHVVVAASNATIDGFVITNGNANGPALDNRGGGIYCYRQTDLTVSNCSLSGNMAGSGGGGGMYCSNSSVAVADCSFLDNSAGYNGGGFAAHTCTVHVSTCTVVGNSVTGSGGGLYAYGCTWHVEECSLFGNSATNVGGGMHSGNSSLEAANCVFSGNTSQRGAGLSASTTTTNDAPTLTNCTFANNAASTKGGGVHYDSSKAMAITNCVLAGNTAPDGPQIYTENDKVDVAYSVVEGGWPDVGAYDADPSFVDADGADDVAGTTDDDLRLLAASPCIDAADGDAAPSHDADGYSRHDDAGVADSGTGTPSFADIGAFEFQGTSATESAVVLAPVPGAALQVGTDVTIEWIVTGDVTDVKIELSRDGGTDWEDVTASTPNDREYTWTVTDGATALPQTSCLVRISDAAGGGPSATSGVVVIFDGWHVDPDAPGPVRDGLTWATAFLHPQDGVDAASPGHSVRVAAGSYVEKSVSDNRVLRMKDGVSVEGGYAGVGAGDPDSRDVAHNATVLDGQQTVETVVFGSSCAALSGMTIRGGYSLFWYGAGLYNYGCVDLTVSECTFRDNQAMRGGAVYNVGGSPTIVNCTFVGNTADFENGGAICSEESSPRVINCIFSGNYSHAYGGAVFNDLYAQAEFINCTFTGNTAILSGGGVYNTVTSEITLTNCISSGNQAGFGPELSHEAGGVTATYSLVRGGWPGAGNLDADPLFVDPDGADDVIGTPDDDVRLHSGSPCIDAADGDAAPATDRRGAVRYDDSDTPDTGTGSVTFVDIGALEWEPSPAESECGGGCTPGPVGMTWIAVVYALLLATRRRGSA